MIQGALPVKQTVLRTDANVKALKCFSEVTRRMYKGSRPVLLFARLFAFTSPPTKAENAKDLQTLPSHVRGLGRVGHEKSSKNALLTDNPLRRLTSTGVGPLHSQLPTDPFRLRARQLDQRDPQAQTQPYANPELRHTTAAEPIWPRQLPVSIARAAERTCRS